MGELTVGSIKQNLFEKLIEGYVKAPPSLKEQGITKLATQLCQNVELTKIIVFQLEPRYILTEKVSSDMCQRVPLPATLKNILSFRIRAIAEQLYSWNRRQAKYGISPLPADSIYDPSDWTVDMRLDETKLAERLVQDERIPLDERYRMACYHCLKFNISSLWQQMSPEPNVDYLYREFPLIRLWSYQIRGDKIHVDPWFHKFLFGVWEESLPTVLNFLNNMHLCYYKREFLVKFATEMHHIRYDGPYIDILCVILTQLTKGQRVKMFQEAFAETKGNVFAYFIRWPYLDLLLPIINELWDILPEATYEELLIILAHYYSEECPYNIRGKDYMDCEYGYLIAELLKAAPDHFKRYVFGDNSHKDIIRVEEGELLLTVLNKGLQKMENINVFKNIWQHVTFEERRSFLRLRETMPYKETLLSM